MRSARRVFALFVSVTVGCVQSSDGPDRLNAASSNQQVASANGRLFVDVSPHQHGFAQLDNVTLHFLDWGGRGPLLLLIPGLGNTAHTYDDFAPQFVPSFHVVALTLRGHGQSDRPKGDYSTGVIVEDVRQFMDLLGARSAVLVGASIGSDVITALAAKYPDRVSKLIYLDEASDASELPELDTLGIVTADMWRQPTRAQYMSRYWEIIEGGGVRSPAMEADMHFGQALGFSGFIESNMNDSVGVWFVRGKQPPRHDLIKAPVLAIFAHGWVWSSVPEKNRTLALNLWNRQRERHAERFRRIVPNAQVELLEGAGHPLLIQRGADVVRLVRRFLEAS